MVTIKRKPLLAAIVFGVLVTCIYVTREAPIHINNFDASLSIENREDHENNDNIEPTLPKTNKKQIAVFLVSQTRSGSSILGELFNRRVGVTYLYEPLYPFREHNGHPLAEALVPKSIEAVEAMARCNLSRLPDLYRDGFRSSKQPDNSGCMRNKLCFSYCNKCALFLRRDARGVRKGETLDLVELGRVCQRSVFVAAKLNYLRGISNISHLLTLEDVDVKIIHLTRDPRATIRSRLKARHLNKTLHVLRSLANEICGRLTENANFVQNEMSGNILSIRHEDFATNPLGTVRSIYNFIGKPPTLKLLWWTKRATGGFGDGTHGSVFGTTGAASHIITAWRSSFNLEEVAAIQEICGDAMQILNYKMYYSDSELKDLSIPSF